MVAFYHRLYKTERWTERRIIRPFVQVVFLHYLCIFVLISKCEGLTKDYNFTVQPNYFLPKRVGSFWSKPSVSCLTILGSDLFLFDHGRMDLRLDSSFFFFSESTSSPFWITTRDPIEARECNFPPN